MFEKKILGLDIGSKYIKLALIKQGKNPEIIRTALVKTPEESVVDGEIRNIESVTACVKTALKENRMSAQELNISINSPNAVVREIKLPALKSNEIDAAVEFELTQSFPGIVQTHTISSKLYTSPNSPIEGIAAFCPNKILDGYVELAKGTGMQLKTIDISANAATRAYNQFVEKPFQGDTILMVDIGYTNSQVNLVSSGKLLASRNIASGLIAIDNLVANRHGITREQAERARLNKKYKIFGIKEEEVAGYTRISLAAIEEQIRYTIDFYKYNKSNAVISGILIAGGGSLFPELYSQLKEMFNLPVSEVKIGKMGPLEAAGNSLLLPAIGVALKEQDERNIINLVPHLKELSKAKSSANKFSVAAAIVVAIALLSTGAYIFLYFVNQVNKAEAAMLTGKIDKFSSVDQLKNRIKNAEDRVDKLSAALNAYNAGTLINTKLFDSISGMMPDSVFTVSYSVAEGNKININGVSRVRTDIAGFIYKLKQVDEIDNVTVKSISARTGEDNKPIDYGFVLDIKLKVGE